MRLHSITEAALACGYVILHWSEDNMDDNYDKWEVIDKAEAIAKRSSIWISRDKTLTFFALSEMGDVLGAVWTAFSRDFEYEDPDDPRDVYVYDFDVVVDERFRNPVDKVGLQLIDAAIGEYKDLASTVERSYIRVYVVNRKLIRFLERKYGFTVESEYGHGPVHMVYYG